jgi:lipopolysaccharide export LptBFGC system permease protein LptF
MQALIREYGHSIITWTVFAAIVALIFTGLSFFSSAGLMTDTMDRGLIRAEAETGEKELQKKLDVKADNIAMAGDTYVGIRQKLYYEKNGDDSLIKLKNGKAERIHINAVYMLKGEEEYSNGYEVTDQVVHEDMDGNDSFMEFTMPGCYRITLSVTDSESVVSNYQLFIHAGKRRIKG